MSDTGVLPSPEQWRASLTEAFRGAGGPRSFAASLDSLCRRASLAAELFFYWRSSTHLETVLGPGGGEVSGQFSRLQLQSLENQTREVVAAQEPRFIAAETGFGGRKPAELREMPWTGEDVPGFNESSHDFYFLPVVLEGAQGGCLVALAPVGPPEQRQHRLGLLAQAATELARALGGRAPAENSRLMADYIGQLRLLEALAGLADPQKAGLLIANYGRLLLGAGRTTVFRAPRMARAALPEELVEAVGDYRLLAASGLAEVLHRSAEAVSIRRAAVAILGSLAARLQEKAAEAGTAKFSWPTLLALALRNQPGAEDRPQELSVFFEENPVDWVAALALRDDEGNITGFLFAEGNGPPPDIRRVQEVVARLDRPLGRALGDIIRRSSMSGRLIRAIGGRGGRPQRSSFPRRWGWLLAGAGAAVLAFSPVDLKLTGEGHFYEGEQATLAAPFRAPLDELRVREGDRFEDGQILALLDVRRQILQREELASRLAREETRRRLALQQGQEREAVLMELEMEAIQAEIDLLDEKVAAARFHAPFAGRVVGPPNLRQRVGSFLEEGENVLQLVSLEGDELVVSLREHDLFEVRRALQEGRVVEGTFIPRANPRLELKFSLRPGETIPVFVDDSDPSKLRFSLRLKGVLGDEASIWGGEASEWTGRTRLLAGRVSRWRYHTRDFFHFLRLRFI